MPDDPESVNVCETAGPGDGARIARNALCEGYDAVVAVGGDGTINDVIQGFCGWEGPQGALGLIPMGTANVLASVLGIPLGDPEAAGALVRSGTLRAIDLAKTDRRWFSLVAGIGFDGAVTRSVDLNLKSHLGRMAYAFAAAKVAMRFPQRRVQISVDGYAARNFDAYMVLVANGSQYAGSYNLGSSVRVDDGMLDVFVLQRRGPLYRAVMEHCLALALDRFAEARGVVHIRAKRVTIDAEGPLPVELDGDAVGETPISIEVVPAAIPVYVPASVPTDLRARPLTTSDLRR
jgi:YegS/Rv2252/BmrU family lipid kinase